MSEIKKSINYFIKFRGVSNFLNICMCILVKYKNKVLKNTCDGSLDSEWYSEKYVPEAFFSRYKILKAINIERWKKGISFFANILY